MNQITNLKHIAIFGHFHSWMGNYKAPCEELSEKLENMGWDVIRATKRVNKAIKLIDMLSAAMKKRFLYDMALIEVYSGLAFIWAEALCYVLKFIRKPYVLWLHGGNLPEFSKKNPNRVKSILKGAVKVVTPSMFLLKEMSIFSDDIILIPNAIHIDRYIYRLREKVLPNLIWLRAFRKIYNPSMAINTLNILVEKGIDARLKMVGPDKGDGSLEEAKSMSAQFNVENRIEFTGGIPKSEVPAYMESHDIFINTTYVDNTPVSVIEAMACGLCVISTRVGGIPDLLDDEKDALLVPPNDPCAMADAVIRILNEGRLSARLSENVRKKAERFSWDLVLPEWIDILEEPGGRLFD